MTIRGIPLSRPIRVAFLTVGLALGSAGTAHAQARPADGLSGRLDPETAAAVRSVIESAAAQGVPREPLAAKALEGQSKGATGERIVLAVRSLATDLAAARSGLGPAASSSEIIAGAGALRAGASADVLRRIKAARGTQSTLMPLATLTDLVARGVPVDQAVGTVLALAERGASEADYRAQGVAVGGREGFSAPTGAGLPPSALPRPGPVLTSPGAPPPGEPANPRPR